MSARSNIVLIADHEPQCIRNTISLLEGEQFELDICTNFDTAKLAIENYQSRNINLAAVIINAFLLEKTTSQDPTRVIRSYYPGITLGRYARSASKRIAIGVIIILSDIQSPQFDHDNRTLNIESLVRTSPNLHNQIRDLLMKGSKINKEWAPKIFIVHGSSDPEKPDKYELKNLLQNKLKLPEPVILHEQSNATLTIIEKLERDLTDIDIAFILLTPDDTVKGKDGSSDVKRARQNVIFEFGYLIAKLGRQTGKVIILHKESVELPTDTHGILYLRYKTSVTEIEGDIRRELERLRGY